MSKRAKFDEIKKIIREDLLSSEIRISIFNSALKNFKRDFLIRPFPAEFLDEDGAKNFDKLNDVVLKIPELDKILNLDFEQLDEDVLNLLHFILVSNKEYYLKTVPKTKFKEILDLAPNILKVANPSYIVEVVYDENNSNAEKKFKKIAEQGFPRKFGYHGTKLHSLQSILNFGLQQHLNKMGLFGEGLYLAHELSVSMTFSSAGIGWEKAKCGDYLNCVLLCEFLEDPSYVKVRKAENARNTDIPEKYLLISNNEIVRTRYLLIYASNYQKKVKTEQNPAMAWIEKNFLTISLILYAILLVLIGLSNSRSGEYYKHVFITKIYQAFERLQNVFVRND